MKYTYFFSECTDSDAAMLGEKAAGIARLFRKGFKVPPGFILSKNVFDLIISEKYVKAAISELTKCTPEKVDECKKKLSEMIHSYEFKEDVADEIIEAYLSLSVDLSMSASSLLETKEVFVSVRGSVISGDTLVHQKTTLNVKGKDKLFSALLEDYADTLAEAISVSKGKGLGDFSMAVIVHKMINADKSGTAFADENGITVKGCFGLGFGLQSDSITPDVYVLDKDYIVTTRDISDKRFEFIRDIETFETVMQDLGDNSKKEVLYDNEVLEIAQALKKVNTAFGKPQSIEWAMKSKVLYILQAKSMETDQKERVELEVVDEPSAPQIIDISDMDNDLRALEQIEEIEKNVPEVTPDLPPDIPPDVPTDDISDLPEPHEDFILPAVAEPDLKEKALKLSGELVVACFDAVQYDLRKRLKKHTDKIPEGFEEMIEDLNKYEKVENEENYLSIKDAKQNFLINKAHIPSDIVAICVDLLRVI